MTLGIDKVKKIANLARIELDQDEIASFDDNLSSIVAFMNNLNEVDITNIAPMTSVSPMALKMRKDVVANSNSSQDVLQNAPDVREGYFVVPKVIE